MINFRVRDLDAIIGQLRAAKIEVAEPEDYPNGRFARLCDPEGNPIELGSQSDSSDLGVHFPVFLAS
jgi:predicted enzyme related to lactoylglutathione lyase